MCLPRQRLSHETRETPDARRPPYSPNRRFVSARVGCLRWRLRKPTEAIHTLRTSRGALHLSAAQLPSPCEDRAPGGRTTDDWWKAKPQLSRSKLVSDSLILLSSRGYTVAIRTEAHRVHHCAIV